MLESSTFRGYGGEIKLAIGIHKNGQLAGVRVIQHSETPGLGDKFKLTNLTGCSPLIKSLISHYSSSAGK